MSLDGIWKHWVLDVTFSPRLPPCYCPYEERTGNVVVGMNYLGKCPGNLVGVYHSDGAEAAEKWVNENPNWRDEYGTSKVGKA